MDVQNGPLARNHSVDCDPGEQRAHLAAILDCSTDAILAKDRFGILTAWNPSAERLYGYTSDEILGRPVSLLIPDDLRGELDDIRASLLAGRAVPPHDTTRIAKSGRRLAVSVAVMPVRSAAGAIIGATAMSHDISQRLAAEAERAWIALLLNQSADAIIALDTDGRITAWNPASEHLFGYSFQEVRGQPLQSVMNPGELGLLTTISASVLEGGQTHRYETTRNHRDGHELTVAVSIAALKAASGVLIGAVLSVRDVTATRAAEQAVQAAQDRAAALLRELNHTRRLDSVGKLAGGIAHDFNNLLAVVLNLSMLVSSELPEGSSARIDVDEIALTAQRAAALTRQLLSFSRQGLSMGEEEVFDLSEVITGLEHFLRRALGEHVVLKTTTDDALWPIQMDRGQMEQVLVNLVINARDAMPDGGRLAVETGNLAVDAEFAGDRAGLEPGRYVVLTVSDSGVGMTPEVLERALEPFFTTKPPEQAGGLGLASVYGIISDAGGRVELHSEQGIGTSVTVYVPATTHAPGAAAAPPQGSLKEHGGSILVVEDAPDVLQITERILVGAGYDVATAGSAEEALAVVRSETKVDLVLTDLIMPGMTGPAMVTKIRAMDPLMKVVFMSGYSHNLLTPEMLTHEASAFLEKPFTPFRLRQAIRELLDRESAAPETGPALGRDDLTKGSADR